VRVDPTPERGRPRTQPRRIVSLVPSLTESLFALGLGDRVVGVTEWCVHPAGAVARVPKVGGTKTPDVEAIRALAPDLVIANQEENRRRDIERLEAAGFRVWLTYPCTDRAGAELLAEVAELGASAEARERVVAPVLRAVADAEAALRVPAVELGAASETRDPRAPPALRGLESPPVRPVRTAGGAHSLRLAVSPPSPPSKRSPPVRTFCPIWRDPWMAVGAPTYADDMIRLCGGVNVFADHAERRYPRVTLADVVAAQPEVVLLPDEPYAFGPRDAADMAALDIPAATLRRIHLIDGTFVSWYGPRIVRAIELLRRLLHGATRG
jgi:ABC-type hemin transport system substrate-binding protein